MFKDHKKFGRGKLIFPSGSVQDGNWDGDKFTRVRK